MTVKGNTLILGVSLVTTLLCGLASSATAKDYLDSRGRKISFPLGDASFADEVVSFEKGNRAAAEQYSQPRQALGAPNFVKNTHKNYVTLGCGGTLTLRFTDNALVDVDGPDLYVFEVGPDVEPTDLSLSTDGEQWVHVGRISGGRAEVDIGAFAKPGDAFHFVQLTDLKSECGSQWPGADIDAVGAIGAGLVISLKSAVLFDVDQWTLKPEAEQELHEAAEKIKQYAGATILIDGHTDSTGSAEHNQVLSKNRAQAVRNHLASTAGIDGARMEIHGYGESRPIVPNDTEDGRERNRRVEIVVIPQAP